MRTGEFALVGPRFVDAEMVALDQVTGRRWAAVGDAVVAFDPIASHGMTMALWSGREAALAAASDLMGDATRLVRYSHTLTQGAARVRSDTRSIYARVERFASAPFWRTRRAAPSPV